MGGAWCLAAALVVIIQFGIDVDAGKELLAAKLIAKPSVPLGSRYVEIGDLPHGIHQLSRLEVGNWLSHGHGSLGPNVPASHNSSGWDWRSVDLLGTLGLTLHAAAIELDLGDHCRSFSIVLPIDNSDRLSPKRFQNYRFNEKIGPLSIHLGLRAQFCGAGSSLCGQGALTRDFYGSGTLDRIAALKLRLFDSYEGQDTSEQHNKEVRGVVRITDYSAEEAKGIAEQGGFVGCLLICGSGFLALRRQAGRLSRWVAFGTLALGCGFLTLALTAGAKALGYG